MGDETKDWRLLDASYAERWDVRPLEWAIEPIIPKASIGVLVGQPKVGKSLLALDMCLTMVHAHLEERRWLGKFPALPAKMLYLACEDPARRVKERIVEIVSSSSAYVAVPEHLLFLFQKRFNLLEEWHQAWLRQELEKYNIDFLVLDVFNRMTGDLDENSARDMNTVFDILEEFNREFGVTIQLVDHTRKPPVTHQGDYQPTPFDLRGSTAKYGNAEFIISVARTRQNNRLRISCENKDSDKKPDFFVDISPKGSPDPKFRWAGDAENLTSERKAVGAANRQKILDVIRQAGLGGASREEICAKTGLSRSTAGSHLSALTDSGAIKKEGHNKNTRYCCPTDRPVVSLRPSSFQQV